MDLQAAQFELSSKNKSKFNKNIKKTFNLIVLTSRRCTDGFFCMLFTLFLIGWAATIFIGMFLLLQL